MFKAPLLQVPALFIESLTDAIQPAVDACDLQAYKNLGAVDTHTYAMWLLEDTITSLAPGLLDSTFKRVHADFVSKHPQSGTTATVLFFCGHELVTANVGDSLAYVDTGTQVLLVTGNHRIDDNKAERERLVASGGVIAQADLEGIGVGPLRIWPGGLAFSRCVWILPAHHSVLI
jgi:hypothetical protein